MVSSDADGIITTWNRAAEELYGWAEKDIVGQSVSVLCPQSRLGEEQRLLRAVAGGAVSIEFDTQRLHKDGSMLDVSVTHSRIMTDGSLTGFCAVTHDIGARVQLRDRLEERVRVGVDDLARSRAEVLVGVNDLARSRAEVLVGVNDLARSRAETVHGLALAAEYRDPETALHTERVGRAASRLAARLGLHVSFVALIGGAAPLHDVGKIGIPDGILLKPRTLTKAEFQVMKQHTVLGSNLLAGSDSELLQLAAQIALTHHERWNGSGYPAGLTGEAIPIAGRIVALVDAFDAMTHGRLYKSVSTDEEARAEISRCSGTQFDPRVVQAFQTRELAVQRAIIISPRA